MDPLTIGMLVILALLIVFMFRNSRKRKRQQEELQQQVVTGADVMTNFGLFGTIISIDTEDNKIELEVAPGTVVTVHRQTVTRVIDDHTPHDGAESDDAPAEPELNTDHTVDDAAPEFGERVDGTTAADKKADE